MNLKTNDVNLELDDSCREKISFTKRLSWIFVPFQAIGCRYSLIRSFEKFTILNEIAELRSTDFEAKMFSISDNFRSFSNFHPFRIHKLTFTSGGVHLFLSQSAN